MARARRPRPASGAAKRGAPEDLMIASIRDRFRKPPPALPDFAPRIKDDDDYEEAYKPIDWAIVRRLLGWLAPFRKQYALGISVGLVHLLLEMSSPLFMRGLIVYVTAYAQGLLAPMPTEYQAI